MIEPSRSRPTRPEANRPGSQVRRETREITAANRPDQVTRSRESERAEPGPSESVQRISAGLLEASPDEPSGPDSPGDVASVLTPANHILDVVNQVSERRGNGFSEPRALFGRFLGGSLGFGNFIQASERFREGDNVGGAVSLFAGATSFGGRRAGGASLVVEGIHQIQTSEGPADDVSGRLRVAAGGLSQARHPYPLIAAGAAYASALAVDFNAFGARDFVEGPGQEAWSGFRQNFEEHGFGSATWEQLSVAP